MNNNGQFLNQQINIPQQPPSNPIINHPQHQLNHLINPQSRFPSLQPRMTNSQPTIIPNQGVVVRPREPQKFNQSKFNFD